MRSGSPMDLERMYRISLRMPGVAMSLGPDKASTLPMFHNLTRCGTVSLFSGCGKKTNWHQCLEPLRHHRQRKPRSGWLCLRDLLSFCMTVRAALWKGTNPPSSASASKPIRLGLAATKQLMVTVLEAFPQAKDTCYELIWCRCKASCRGRCKCVKANLACTGLCNCGGNCQQP